MTILPLTYLGNTEYFSRLLSGDCVIDTGENYVKQTYRNRCDILTANGAAALTVNVVKGGSKTKKPLKDIRIDYSKRWQHQHWATLVSAYANSPYFSHYGEYFRPFFERRYEFLADFNMELLRLMLRLMKIDDGFRVSEIYVESAPGDIDLRGSFDTGLKGGESSSAMETAYFEPYYQVFPERFGFVPNLSAIDLLFCEGPHAAGILRQTRFGKQ